MEPWAPKPMMPRRTWPVTCGCDMRFLVVRRGLGEAEHQKVWRSRASEEIGVAEGDEVVPRGLQAVVGVAAVLVVLLDEEVLGAGGDRLVDDLGPVEVALADLAELHHPREGLQEGGAVARLEGLEGGRRQLTDAIVLEVHEVDQTGVLLQGADRVPATTLDPVHVDLEPHGGCFGADDVQDRAATASCELEVMVVVVQREP